MAKRVIVVGSGIIGASIAYHLAKAGAEVTVIEAGETGGLATRASWAWINASWGNPEPYFRLRVRAIEHWHKMQSEIPQLAINWCGGLIWDLPPAELDAYAAERAKLEEALRVSGNAYQREDLFKEREQFDTNVFGLFAMTRAVLPGMRARRAGHVMNITSVAGLVGYAGSGHYAASKHAVEGWSDSLAAEVAPLGIRVTCIEPGPFRTDFAGRSLRQTPTRIAEYDATAGARLRGRAAQPARPRRCRRNRLRHHRQLADLETHRRHGTPRRTARDRRLERLAHHALQPRHRRLG